LPLFAVIVIAEQVVLYLAGGYNAGGATPVFKIIKARLPYGAQALYTYPGKFLRTVGGKWNFNGYTGIMLVMC
jgi:hypothetical protein